MPSGYVMPYQMPPHSAPRRPSLALRARVWLKRIDLDARLAGGAHPTRNKELRLRAMQLHDPKRRARLAAAVERLLVIAGWQTRSGVIRPQGPFGPSEVLANRELLGALAERLRDSRFDSLQGLAMSSTLLHDAREPLSLSRRPRALKDALRGALSALDASRAEAPASIKRRREVARSMRKAA